jgi:succinate-acetate transporter protein
MDWTTILQFVRPELFILIVFIWCIGLFLKRAPGFKGDWKIPFILLFLSIIFAILYVAVIIGEGFTGPVIISAVIQGVIIAALAVFGNEAIKQVFVKRLQDE